MKHWLFVLYNDRIWSMGWDDDKKKYEPVYIRGSAEVDYQDDFWKRWEENTGFIESEQSQSKFCLCGDFVSQEMTLPDYVKTRIDVRFWNPVKIREALSEKNGFPHELRDVRDKVVMLTIDGEKVSLRILSRTDVLQKTEIPAAPAISPSPAETPTPEVPAPAAEIRPETPKKTEIIHHEAEKAGTAEDNCGPLTEFDIQVNLRSDPKKR